MPYSGNIRTEREPAGQPYLYGGKERIRDNGLNEYDYSARRLCSALALWTAPDPLAQQYGPTNPYVYCSANPIKYIDPTGKKGELVFMQDAVIFKANFYATHNSVESCKYGNSIINELSNKYKIEIKNLDTNQDVSLPLIFEVQTVEVEYDNVSERSSINFPTSEDLIGNAYEVVKDGSYGKKDEKTIGRAIGADYSTVTESNSFSLTSAHEQLHNMGMKHHPSGIMTEESIDSRRSKNLSKNGLLEDIKRILENPNNNPNRIKVTIVEGVNFDLNNIKIK